MTYEIVVDPVASTAFAKLDDDDQRAVIAAYRDLASNPQPTHGYIGRLHVGWLRIVFEVVTPETDESPGSLNIWSIGRIS